MFTFVTFILSINLNSLSLGLEKKIYASFTVYTCGWVVVVGGFRVIVELNVTHNTVTSHK